MKMLKNRGGLFYVQENNQGESESITRQYGRKETFPSV